MTDINSRDINNSSDSEASMSTVEARPESVKKPDGSIARRKRNKKEGSSDSSAAQSGAHKAQKDEGVLPSNESQGGNKDQKKAKKLTHITELDDQVKEVIDDALDESADALGLYEDSREVSGISLAHAARILFGVFVLVFAAIGIIACVNYIKEQVELKNANLERISYFETLIMPISASDMPTFEDVSALNNDVIITAACWDIILSPSASYTVENGMYRVSYLEIESRVNKLFGRGVSCQHTSVGDEELMFEYDEAAGMYLIPYSPRSIAYYATVDQIEEIENGYRLTVSYHLPISNWITLDVSPEKIMLFELTSNGIYYNISSLNISEIINKQGV